MNRLLVRCLAPIALVGAIGAQADQPSIVSAGYGDPILPAIANFAFCRGNAASVGLGGLPVVISEPVDTMGGYMGDANGLDPNAFQVTVGAEGRQVRPVCATLAPAVDSNERRTILLIGDFGIGGNNGPTAVNIVGNVMTTEGSNLSGASFAEVAGVNGGPSLVIAESFNPPQTNTSQLGDGTRLRFCPTDGTAQIVKLTFSGGVTGPLGARLRDDDAAMAAIEILAIGANGERSVLHPFALRDDDNDNHLDACLGADAVGMRLVRAQVDSHHFYAPQNVPNPAATVRIEPNSAPQTTRVSP
ncbi:MAG: hypothetical protein AAF290_00435 [Pseudomonadota bacterium]